jgi:hypothetical protein
VVTCHGSVPDSVFSSSIDKRKNHGLNTYAGKKNLNIGRLACNGKTFSVSFLSKKLLQAQQTIQ